MVVKEFVTEPTPLVLQFKITLLEIEPPIWRRIVVPEDYTFWDLHVAIQDAMGWLDYHLHSFVAQDIDGDQVEIGIPPDDDEPDDTDTEPGWEVFLPEIFIDPGDVAIYTYDFGDNWYHHVLLEGIFLAEKGAKYPKCIGGERACPPEDCGGSHGYDRLIEILQDKNHEEHDAITSWLKGHEKNYYPYDPDLFRPEDVHFSDPKERFDLNFETAPDLNGH